MTFTRQRGSAAVEMAIVAVPMLVLLVGTIEVGRAMYYYNSLVKLARDAARLLTLQSPTDPDYATLKAGAACAAWTGDSTVSSGQCTASTAALPGLSAAMVSICDSVTAACLSTHQAVATTFNGVSYGVINLVTVSIGSANNPYTYTPAVPLLGALMPAIAFSPISVTMRHL